jgi:hypothetical protein
VRLGGGKDLRRFFQGERALFAEYIHELGKLPPRGFRDHLFTDDFNVFL